MRGITEKIMTAAQAAALRDSLEARGGRLVFTNGCFDLLHRGHADYLSRARRLGDGLVVAVNSDASVTELKGPLRPLVKEMDRAFLLASLECVDGVVIFQSPKVDGLLREVKPHIYVKGGDYTVETLDAEEREALYAVGAEIRLLSFVDGFSTSNILRDIEQGALAADATRRAGEIRTVFLDRDGVLNREGGHVTEEGELEVLPGAGAALRRLQEAGIGRVVITNQSGIARGLISEDNLERIHAKLRDELAKEGGFLDAIYVSPWHPDTGIIGGVAKYLRISDERKPGAGLIFRAMREMGLDLAHCAFVGDSGKDLVAARKAGIPFYAVKSGKMSEFPGAMQIHESLGEAVSAILDRNTNL